jgi:hypothetical protein
LEFANLEAKMPAIFMIAKAYKSSQAFALG